MDGPALRAQWGGSLRERKEAGRAAGQRAAMTAAFVVVTAAFARTLATFPVCCSTTCSWSCSRLAGGVVVVVAPPSQSPVHSRLRHRTNSAVMTLPSQRRPAMARRHAAVVCTDYTTAAVTFFSNVRVPATLVAATAIKEAFVLVSVPRDLAASQGWRILRRCYTLLMLFSFSEELSCVFISTGVMMLLQSGTLDTKAPSLVALLARESDTEVACWWGGGISITHTRARAHTHTHKTSLTHTSPPSPPGARARVRVRLGAAPLHHRRVASLPAVSDLSHDASNTRSLPGVLSLMFAQALRARQALPLPALAR